MTKQPKQVWWMKWVCNCQNNAGIELIPIFCDTRCHHLENESQRRSIFGNKADLELYSPEDKTPDISDGGFTIGGPTRTWTWDQRIMLTTTAFAACFQFVVWTVSCLYDLPVQSLHLPNIAIGLGSGLPRCEQHRLPRIWVVLHASRVNLPACNPTANDHDILVF